MGTEPVADPAYGLDLGGAVRPVDLTAQVGDILVDDVGDPVVGEVPGAFQNDGPGEHLALMAHEQFEERERFRRQKQLMVTTPGLPGSGVEGEITRPEHDGPGGDASPDQRSDPGGELAETERFCEVVVGTDVQAADAIVHGVARGEHEHRRPAIGGAQPPAHLETVDLREHHVQDDCAVGELTAMPDRVRTVHGDVDGVALLLQATLEQRGHPLLVLNHQNPHFGKPMHASMYRR